MLPTPLLTAFLLAASIPEGNPSDLLEVVLLPGRGEASIRFHPAGGGAVKVFDLGPGDGGGFLHVEPGNTFLLPASSWDRLDGLREGPFRIEVTAPEDEEVLASGRLIERRPGTIPGFSVTAFAGAQADRGLGLYLITMPGPGAHRLEAGRRAAAAMLEAVLPPLEARFGPLPSPRPRAVVLELPAPLARAYPGVVILDARLVAERAGSEESRAAILAHEVAHLWWGNRVAAAGPGGASLFEGLAEFAALEAVARVKGEEAAERLWEALRREYMLASELLADGRVSLLTDGPESAMRPLRYARAAWVIRMLAERVGEAPLSRVLAARLATARPLGWDALLEDLESDAGLDLAAFREGWIASSGHPYLLAESDAQGGTITLHNGGRGGGEVAVAIECAGSSRLDAFVAVPAGERRPLALPEAPPSCAVRIDPRGRFLHGPRGPAPPPGLVLAPAWGHAAVRHVVAGGVAERAGLRQGDLILAARHQPVDETDLETLTRDLRAPDPLLLKVRRGLEVLEITWPGRPAGPGREAERSAP
jgi:hypothetical protein